MWTRYVDNIRGQHCWKRQLKRKLGQDAGTTLLEKTVEKETLTRDVDKLRGQDKWTRYADKAVGRQLDEICG